MSSGLVLTVAVVAGIGLLVLVAVGLVLFLASRSTRTTVDRPADAGPPRDTSAPYGVDHAAGQWSQQIRGGQDGMGR